MYRHGNKMYVMVTQWTNHWDRISGNRTRYNDYMFRNGMNSNNYRENEPTIFIKLSENEPHDTKKTAYSENKTYNLEYELSGHYYKNSE
jgi:hypothetical protein